MKKIIFSGLCHHLCNELPQTGSWVPGPVSLVLETTITPAWEQWPGLTSHGPDLPQDPWLYLPHYSHGMHNGVRQHRQMLSRFQPANMAWEVC